uniref:Uncharacterized protein n=1 Tax=Triticum urartu TaxID=4572 RepID=A0A8R7QYQ6_TRIUA
MPTVAPRRWCDVPPPSTPPDCVTPSPPRALARSCSASIPPTAPVWLFGTAKKLHAHPLCGPLVSCFIQISQLVHHTLLQPQWELKNMLCDSEMDMALVDVGHGVHHEIEHLMSCVLVINMEAN